MNEQRLFQYIKGAITSETETVEILDWIESSDENQQKFTQLKNLWVLQGLTHSDKGFIPEYSLPAKAVVQATKSRFGSFLKYAAVFILAFAMGSLSLYYFNKKEREALACQFNTIEVPYGERSQITLYDGTKVWLNSGTKFRYPVVFRADARDVIMDGEGYFEVAKDTSRPFIVWAGQLKVKVLGTHFDLCAYPEDNEFSTTLDEGSVNVTNTCNGASMIMTPGQQVILNRETNGLKQHRVDSKLYTSWKENLLKLEDSPFDEVIKKMERWYDVKITVDPSVNSKERFTMTIKTESLREMLQLVSRTTKINYTIKEDIVRIYKL